MTGPSTNAALEAAVAEELARPAMAEAQALSSAILARHGDSVAAVLFYGSCLRTGDSTGILDVYVLTDGLRAYHGRRWPALLNALIPPTVSYLEVPFEGRTVRAKVAVMGLGAFARAVRGRGADTTIWARFCQPAALLHARDPECRRRAVSAVAQAVATAAGWAARLSPPGAAPAERWTALFQHTYGAELRAERGNRPNLVYDWAAERYDRLMGLALTGRAEVGDRKAARRAWARRRVAGKLLNILRLGKAAFTFENGVDYILWKLERHAGRRFRISGWERRHPILAAPALLWRLYREGMIR